MSLFQAGNPTAMTPTAKNNQNTGLLSTTAASGEKMYAKIQGLNVPTDPRNMLQSMTQPINMQTNINTATAATAATAGTTSNPSVNLFNPSANQFNPSTNQLIPSANPYPPTISFDPNSPHPPLNPPSNPPPTINLQSNLTTQSQPQPQPSTGFIPHPQQRQPHQTGGTLSTNVRQNKAIQQSLPPTTIQYSLKLPHTQHSRTQVHSSISFFDIYKKIKNNQSLSQDDQTRLSRNFSLLISSNQTKDLQTMYKTNHKIQIQQLNGLQPNQKSIMQDYWQCILQQFCLQHPFVSLQCAQQLIRMHIKYNLTLYYPNGFFNITRFKTADSFIESSNTISSISTNSNMFRQIVGEIIALWRKNLFVLRKCFEEITARQYRRIDKGKLLEEIMKNLWIGYQQAIICEGKSSKDDQMQTITLVLKLIITAFRTVSISQDLANQMITFIDRHYLELCQYQKSTKIYFLQQLVLNILLVHPYNSNFTSSRQIQNVIQNSDNFLFIPLKLILQGGHTPQLKQEVLKQIRGKHWKLLVDVLIKGSQDMVYLSDSQHEFIFTAVCALLVDNAEYFWQHLPEHQAIIEYLGWLGRDLEQRDDGKSGRLQRITKVMTCAVGQTHSKTDEWMKQTTAEKTIKFFSTKVLKMHSTTLLLQLQLQSFYTQQIGQQSVDQTQFSLSHIHEYFLTLLTNTSTIFTPYYKTLKKTNFTQQTLLTKLIVTTLYKLKQPIPPPTLTLIFSTLQNILFNTRTTTLGRQLIIELSHHHHRDQLILQLMLNQSNHGAIIDHIIVLLQPALTNRNDASLASTDWFRGILQACNSTSKHVDNLHYANFAKLLTECLELALLDSSQLPYIDRWNLTRTIQFINWTLYIEFTFQDTPINKLICAQHNKQLIIAIKLLYTLCKCYLQESTNSNSQILPSFVRKLLVRSNKDGWHQVQIANNRATSYIAALAVVLISAPKQSLSSDNQDLIYKTMVLLSRIQLAVNNTTNQLFIQQQFSNNRTTITNVISLNDSLAKFIIKHPSSLGMQFLLSSQWCDQSVRKRLAEQLSSQKFIHNTNIVQPLSLYLFTYIKQNRSKRTPNNDIWSQLDSKMQIIQLQLLSQQQLTSTSIHNTFQNLGKLLQHLQLLDINIYLNTIAKYHRIFLSEKCIQLHEDQQTIKPSIFIGKQYYKALLLLLNCRGVLNQDDFKLFKGITYIEEYVKVLIDMIVMLMCNYQCRLEQQELLFGVVLAALKFLSQLSMDKNVFKNYLQDVVISLSKRMNIKNRTLTNTNGNIYEEQNHGLVEIEIGDNQIVLSLFINIELGRQLKLDQLQMTHPYWILQTAISIPALKLAQTIIRNLPTFKHPTLFASALGYLARYATSNSFKLSNDSFKTLSQMFIDAIQTNSSYEVIWYCELFIEIINANIIRSTKLVYQRNIHTLFFANKLPLRTLGNIFNSLSLLLTNQPIHWLNYHYPAHGTLQNINLSQKQQAIAYLRVLCLLVNDDDTMSQTTINRNEFIRSLLSLLPLLTNSLNNKPQAIQTTPFQQKLKDTQLIFLSQRYLKSTASTLSTKDAITTAFNNIVNSLQLFHELINTEIVCHSITLIISILHHTSTQGLSHNHTAHNCALIEANQLENMIALAGQLVNKIILIEHNKNAVQQLLTAFAEKIYYGSIETTEEMYFLNCNSTSASINVYYGDYKDQLTDCLLLLLQTIRKIFEAMKQLQHKNYANAEKLHRSLFSVIKRHIQCFTSQIQRLCAKDVNKSRSQWNTTRSNLPRRHQY